MSPQSTALARQDTPSEPYSDEPGMAPLASDPQDTASSRLRSTAETRRVTRQTTHGRSGANYDAKLHPMDRFTRPGHWAKRLGRELPRDNVRRSRTYNDTDDEEEDLSLSSGDGSSPEPDSSLVESPRIRVPDPRATRHSQRAAAHHYHEYRANVHPDYDKTFGRRGKERSSRRPQTASATSPCLSHLPTAQQANPEKQDDHQPSTPTTSHSTRKRKRGAGLPVRISFGPVPAESEAGLEAAPNGDRGRWDLDEIITTVFISSDRASPSPESGCEYDTETENEDETRTLDAAIAARKAAIEAAASDGRRMDLDQASDTTPDLDAYVRDLAADVFGGAETLMSPPAPDLLPDESEEQGESDERTEQHFEEGMEDGSPGMAENLSPGGSDSGQFSHVRDGVEVENWPSATGGTVFDGLLVTDKQRSLLLQLQETGLNIEFTPSPTRSCQSPSQLYGDGSAVSFLPSPTQSSVITPSSGSPTVGPEDEVAGELLVLKTRPARMSAQPPTSDVHAFPQPELPCQGTQEVGYDNATPNVAPTSTFPGVSLASYFCSVQDEPSYNDDDVDDDDAEEQPYGMPYPSSDNYMEKYLPVAED